MHDYKNIFQYKSVGKIYSSSLDYENDEDMGSYYTAIYTLHTKSKTYYLAVYGGSESTKDYYEGIRIYSIENDSLNDSLALIKTPKGLVNSINFEYDAFSVLQRPERPIILIKYDTNKKIIYIPVVLENGKVTNNFLNYQFDGKYFVYIPQRNK